MSANYSLLCYTREATGREEANNEDIAYSMHLALRSGDDAEWQQRRGRSFPAMPRSASR